MSTIYTSAGPDTQIEGMADVRPIGLRAMRVEGEFRVRNAHGNYDAGAPGDYLLQSADGTLSVSPAAVFEVQYEFIEARISGEPDSAGDPEEAETPPTDTAPRKRGRPRKQ